MAEKVEQTGEDTLEELRVRTLAMSLYGFTILLPNTLVAEVTEVASVETAANTPDWLSGFVNWRGRNVPLVSYERLLGQDTIERHDGSRMVVLNTLNGNPQLPFIAMEIQGLPHMSLLSHDMVEYEDNDKAGEPVVLSSLRVEGDSVLVPNIDVIERMLENLGISV